MRRKSSDELNARSSMKGSKEGRPNLSKRNLKKNTKKRDPTNTTSSTFQQKQQQQHKKPIRKESASFKELNDINELDRIETELFEYVKTPTRRFYVNIGKQNKIWTLSANTANQNVPIVAVHGFLGAIGFWIHSVDTLAERNPFYAFDLLGFGRSSRPSFNSDPLKAEKEFIESIEEWRREMKLERMILVGHSFGGYLSTLYSMQYPERVKALILVESWGWGERNYANSSKNQHRIIWEKLVEITQKNMNFMNVLRSSGSFGVPLTKVIRPSYKKIFQNILDDSDLIYRYIYYANSFYPSGEMAFKTMSIGFYYAKNPLMLRKNNLSQQLPIWFIHGEKTFIDSNPSFEVMKSRPRDTTTVKIIEDGCHHVYASKPDEFNQFVHVMLDKIAQLS